MFNRKKIEQLEAQLADKDRKIHRLEDLLARNEKKLELIQNTLDSTPADCKPSEYCKVCSFSKAYMVFNRHTDDFDVMYLCNKAGSCQNFVQKEKQ
jgi:hypothetical protein